VEDFLSSGVFRISSISTFIRKPYLKLFAKRAGALQSERRFFNSGMLAFYSLPYAYASLGDGAEVLLVRFPSGFLA